MDNWIRSGHVIHDEEWLMDPHFEDEEAFDMANFTRSGHVCRVENVNNHIRRVAIQFGEALPFKPGEQSGNEIDTEKKLSTIPV